MEYKKNNIFLFLLILVFPLIFATIFWRFGLEDSDSGFLIGLGWRIYNSEIIYKDFLYIRPPLSPYLIYIFLEILPEYGQIFYLRVLNSYQLMIGIVLTYSCLNKFYSFEELKINFGLLVLISYIFTAANTLYFQWHTTDGLFFAIAGYWFAINSRNSIFRIAIAAFLMFASAMTKQNYLLVPLFGIFLLFHLYSLKEATKLFIFFILYYFIIILIAKHYDVYKDYILLTSGAGSLKDILFAGFFAYFANSEYFFAFIGLILFEAILIKNLWFINYNYKKIFILLVPLNLALCNIAYILFTHQREIFIRYDRILSVVVFLVFTYSIVEKKEKIENHIPLLILLITSWVSSISWGGMSPAMYLSPIIFAVYYFLEKYQHKYFDNFTKLFISTCIVMISIFQNLIPYRNNFLWESTKNGIDLSNKLAYIKVDAERFNKHQEVKKLLKQYDTLLILPSMPNAYYLYDVKNPFIMDWSMDIEAGYKKTILKDVLTDCCEYIAIEKKLVGQEIGMPGSKFFSSVSNHVVKNYKLIKSYEYFDIYISQKID